MSVKKTAYDTTACQGFVMTKTVEALQEANIKGWLQHVPGTQVLMVVGAGASDAAIPAFSHPVLFDDAHKHPTLAVDVRSFGSFDAANGQFRVRNQVEYSLAITRARLNWVWVKDSPSLMRDISPLPLQVFATWIAENVARRFALNPAEQMHVSIYAALWYLSNFIDNAGAYSASKEDAQRMAMAISRILRIKPEDVHKVFHEDNNGVKFSPGEGAAVLSTAAHFCNAISGISVRLQALNAGVLFAILGGTWYGSNAKEMVAVALEHPPTWLAILLAAVNERSFKNSGITKITERHGFREPARSYQAAVLNLLAHSHS